MTSLLLRSCLVISLLLYSADVLSGQGLRQLVLEEIKAAPKKAGEVWEIGDRQMVVNQNTLVHKEYPATIGNLAIVEFVELDGKSTALQIQPIPISVASLTDGPYVFWKDATTAEVITFANGKMSRREIENITEPTPIDGLPGAIKSIVLDPEIPKTPKTEWETPEKLMAISDLEGNYANALKFLKNNQVVDQEGNWSWGKGHLVLVGDLVDRGDAVTETMCLMRQLERQATAAGGQVHYVLGNHEAMVMDGDLRYIHPKYHFISSRMGISYDKLYGPNSDVGRWWRTKNAVIRVGDLLFVHGGYSPMLDRAQFSLEALNRRIREGLHPNRPTGVTVAANPVLHIHGPFWYRGYFAEHAAEWGGQAQPSEIERILQRHHAKHVVIGHTVVEEVGPIDRSQQVIAIDVKWANEKKCQGLLQEKGVLYRVTMDGKKEPIITQTNK